MTSGFFPASNATAAWVFNIASWNANGGEISRVKPDRLGADHFTCHFG